MSSNSIYLTKPSLPDFIDFQTELLKIWDSKILTNNGEYHKRFEEELKKYLNNDYVTITCNATIALMIAIKSYNINIGSIVTTPFTFPATTSAIKWIGCNPIFCDIDENTLSFSEEHLDKILTLNAVEAILPVDVYGLQNDDNLINNLIKKQNSRFINKIPIIHDSAHMFGVKKLNNDNVDFDDCMVYSFHATKLFNSIEGGCIAYKDPDMKRKAELLKNFGIKNEEEREGYGINGKMNEFQALVGLLNLKNVDKEIQARSELFKLYKENLLDLNDKIRLIEGPKNLRNNYAYVPIILKNYNLDVRDELYNYLRESDIMTRKYFYPLCCEKEDINNFPVAKNISENVLCLPMYGELSPEKVIFICEKIKDFFNKY